MPAQTLLVARFLETIDNPGTTRAYHDALRGLAAFLRAGSEEIAARRLVRAGLEGARELASRFRTHLVRRRLSAATVRLRLAGLRAFCAFARKVGLIAWPLEVDHVRHVPYRDTAGPGRATVSRLLAHLARNKSARGRRDLALVRLLYDLGLRFQGERLMVAGKGRAGERVPLTLPPRTRQALARWLRVRPELAPMSAALFVADNGARLTGRDVYDIVTAGGRAIGVKLRPHGLRHTAITDALAATRGNMRAVAKFARHSNMAITARYDDNRADLAGQIAATVARRT